VPSHNNNEDNLRPAETHLLFSRSRC